MHAIQIYSTFIQHYYSNCEVKCIDICFYILLNIKTNCCFIIKDRNFWVSKNSYQTKCNIKNVLLPIHWKSRLIENKQHMRLQKIQIGLPQKCLFLLRWYFFNAAKWWWDEELMLWFSTSEYDKSHKCSLAQSFTTFLVSTFI